MSKRVKHVASGREHGGKRKSIRRGGSPQNPPVGEEENMEMDPYFAPERQEERFVKFATRKPTFIRYTEMSWFIHEGFEFPALLQTQGVHQFLDLKGNIYTNLVKEFYANFLYRDETYQTMVKGVRIVLDDSLFLSIANLRSEWSSVNDCDERWSTFDMNDMYKSCLKGPHLYIEGALKKAGSLTVDNRLLHYILVYLLMPRKSNHAQPTELDLKYMFAMKQGILINWPNVILNIMYDVSLSAIQPLPYGILISRFLDYKGIDTAGQPIETVTESRHLFGERLIHKMNIYKYGGEWMNQEDYDPEVDLDLEDEDMAPAGEDQPQEHQAQEDIPRAAEENVPGFGIAHLDAMEQRLNVRIQDMETRMTDRLQGMDDRFVAAIQQQGDAMQANFDRMTFLFRTLGGFNQPPQPPNP